MAALQCSLLFVLGTASQPYFNIKESLIISAQTNFHVALFKGCASGPKLLSAEIRPTGTKEIDFKPINFD